MAFGSRIDEAVELLGTAPRIDGDIDKVLTLEEAALHYIDHPYDWVEDILGMQYDIWQREASKALADTHFVAVRSGHGVGKSTFMATTLLWFLSTHPFCKIIATAPTKEQLFDVLWAECSRWIRESKTLSSILQWTQEKIYIKAHPEEWFAVARTAEVRKLGKTGLAVAESMQGRHAENILYLIDEASGIDEAIMETVDGALTTENVFVVMAGNPTRPHGAFFDAFHSKRRLWHTIQVNSEESPRVSKAWIARMLDKFGSRDHPMYMIRVRGDFPHAQHNSLFSLDNIEAASISPLRADPYDSVELGIDVARYGGDDTAFCARKGPEVLDLQKFPQLSTMETAGKAIQWIAKFRPVAVKIDVVGVGAGVYDRLRELGYRECIAVNGASQPRDTSQFINLRAEAHWHLRTLLEKAAIKLPGTRDKDTGHIVGNDDLIAQMTPITWKVQSKGKIQIESKEDMRSRGVKSPDLLDALVLAFQPAYVPVSHSYYADYNIMGR